ncbi:TIGR03862 family flavoprotein [Rhodobacteraceae bacterium]|nr:TIGR03862 family flavoprotein [Paracoccaceae bacterium]
MSDHPDALVIGGGPAGLMAAQVIAAAGHSVVLAETKPTLARKFLMAGKSGLNLTKAESPETFRAHYRESWIRPYIDAFGPQAVQDFAQGLGIEVFTGSTGRVFPRVMKASPLLRAWIARLGAQGVDIRTRMHWQGWSADGTVFDTPQGRITLHPKTTVLAMGGASWSRLGSTGAWAPILAQAGVDVAPFKPANMGFRVTWSDHMAPHFGKPLKNIALSAAGTRLRGECVISANGLEGGGIYELSATLREGAALTFDLMPDISHQLLCQRLSATRGKNSLSNHLRRVTRLEPVKLALLNEWARPLPQDPAALASRLKALPARLDGPRSLDEAISTAGGITASSLTPDLELRACAGVFAAGEMLDWEAPTGGYLLTACLATGHHAGMAVVRALG